MFDRTPLLLCLFAIALLLFCGCANLGGYFRDRANDFVDCFAAQVGTCTGFGIRVHLTSYIGASVGLGKDKKTGYIGRTFVKDIKTFWVGMPLTQILSLYLATLRPCYSGPKPTLGEYLTATLVYFLSTDAEFFVSCHLLGVDPSGYRAVSDQNIPFLREKFFVGCSVTLGVIGFDIGFNPVEFVDFLLGWFTIDIAGDDNARCRPRLRIGPDPP